MSNTFRNSSVVIQEAALQLYNSLRLGKLVHRYSAKEYKPAGVGAVGPTIDVPLPIRFEAKAGPGIQRQNIVERTLPVTIDQDFHVAMDMAVFDATMNTKEQITKASSKYIQPAIKALADKVDDYLAGLALNLHQTAGTAGTTPGSGTAAQTQQIFADAMQIMTENGVSEQDEKYMILNPKAAGYVPSALSGLFVREAQEAVTKGKIGHALGFDFYSSNNIRRHTAGTLAAAAVSNGTDQEGDSIAVNTLDTSDNLQIGDVITFAGVYAVNPVNKRTVSSLRLMEFRVTALASESGNAFTVSISPALVTSGAYQNVSNAIANGSAVVKKASHVANMAIIKDTLCLATMPLQVPRSAVVAEQVTHEGLTLLLTAGYDIDLRQETARIDIIFGGREMYPETGVRLLG